MKSSEVIQTFVFALAIRRGPDTRAFWTLAALNHLRIFLGFFFNKVDYQGVGVSMFVFFLIFSIDVFVGQRQTGECLVSKE